MKLSVTVPYSGDPSASLRQVRRLEEAGVDMVWVPEAYSFDAVSLLGFLAGRTDRIELAAGILPIYSRTPALLAMTAAGLDAVSGGRFSLGLGSSGPQVIEGWHGVAFDRPIARTRDIVEICRRVWHREPLDHQGRVHQVPLPPEQGTGLGKPLKLINRPIRSAIPIYIASLGPKNIQMTAEVADGWLPIFFHPEKASEVWGDDLAAGRARRDPSLGPLEVVAGGTLAICDEHEATAIRDAARPGVALYIGGMGARGQNFYNDLLRRYGYEREAAEIQDLYLSGRKEDAARTVPGELLDAMSLVGDPGRIRERIEAYRAAGVTRLSITPVGADAISTVEKVRGWIG